MKYVKTFAIIMTVMIILTAISKYIIEVPAFLVGWLSCAALYEAKKKYFK